MQIMLVSYYRANEKLCVLPLRFGPFCLWLAAMRPIFPVEIVRNKWGTDRNRASHSEHEMALLG